MVCQVDEIYGIFYLIGVEGGADTDANEKGELFNLNWRLNFTSQFVNHSPYLVSRGNAGEDNQEFITTQAYSEILATQDLITRPVSIQVIDLLEPVMAGL